MSRLPLPLPLPCRATRPVDALAVALAVGALAAALASPAHAELAQPGRVRAPHPTAAAETALAVAQARLDAGDPEGALAALAQPSAQSDTSSMLELTTQPFRLAWLRGLALGRAGRLADAAAPLRDASRLAHAHGRALAPGAERLLGRAERAAGDCAAALAAFRRAGGSVFADADAALAQARCQLERGARSEHEGLEARGRALATLDASLHRAGRTPTLELLALRARVLADLGVPGAAREDVATLAAALAPGELAALAADLADAPVLAALCVDAGLARFPDEPAFAALAARLWQARAPRSAARVAERGAALDPAASPDAAELLRAAGDVDAARRHNAGVADGARRLRQRLALAVDEADWDRALALRPALERAGLFADDAVAYALAWASHSVGDSGGAEALLEHVDDNAWFERATSLRAAIAQASVCAAGSTEAPCAR